jgi:hypothetical protein
MSGSRYESTGEQALEIDVTRPNVPELARVLSTVPCVMRILAALFGGRPSQGEEHCYECHGRPRFQADVAAIKYADGRAGLITMIMISRYLSRGSVPFSHHGSS